MVHHDLRSLFYEAQAVVRVVELGEATRNGLELTRFEVLRSYQGALVPGDVLAVSNLASYRAGRDGGRDDIGRAECVLFLAEPSKESGHWRILPSGLRIRQGARWMAFVQTNTPGPYVPWPQGIESVVPPVSGVVRYGLLDSAFEHELARAKEGAALVRETIRSGTDAELVALGREVARVPRGPAGFFENAAHEAILDRLMDRGRLGTTLPPQATTRPVRPSANAPTPEGRVAAPRFISRDRSRPRNFTMRSHGSYTAAYLTALLLGLAAGASRLSRRGGARAAERRLVLALYPSFAQERSGVRGPKDSRHDEDAAHSA